MTAPLPPEQIAELKALMEKANAETARLAGLSSVAHMVTDRPARTEYVTGLLNAAPALLDAAERVAELEAALARARSRKACECDCGYCEQGHIYEGLDGNGNPLAAEEGNTRHDAGEGKK